MVLVQRSAMLACRFLRGMPVPKGHRLAAVLRSQPEAASSPLLRSGLAFPVGANPKAPRPPHPVSRVLRVPSRPPHVTGWRWTSLL